MSPSGYLQRSKVLLLRCEGDGLRCKEQRQIPSSIPDVPRAQRYRPGGASSGDRRRGSSVLSAIERLPTSGPRKRTRTVTVAVLVGFRGAAWRCGRWRCGRCVGRMDPFGRGLVAERRRLRTGRSRPLDAALSCRDHVPGRREFPRPPLEEEAARTGLGLTSW